MTEYVGAVINWVAKKSDHKEDYDPWLILLLSELVPGLGQVLSGRITAGLAIFILVTIGYSTGLWFLFSYTGDIISGWVILFVSTILFFFNMVDAFFRARTSNSADFEHQRTGQKDPFRAMFFSSLLPGIGHLYLNRWVSGLVLLFTAIVSKFYDSNVYVNVASILFSGAVLYHTYILFVPKTSSRHPLVKWIIYIFVFESLSYAVVVAIVTTLCFNYTTLIGNSGSPTVIPGDVSLYDIRARTEMRRGDLLTIQGDWRSRNWRIGKRLVAFEDETIEIKGGGVYIDDRRLNEPPFNQIQYVVDSTSQYATNGRPYKVPQGCLFVLGDNSSVSFDSRQIGPIKVQSVIGVDYKIIWPLWRVKKLREP